MATRTQTNRNRSPTQNGPTGAEFGYTERRRWHRHLIMATCSAGLVDIFWATRSNWVAEMRR